MSAAQEMEKKAASAPPGEMAGGMGALMAALAVGGEVYPNPEP